MILVSTTDECARVAQVIAGESFQSQRPNEIHFGLGNSSKVKELRVIWPNGTTNILSDPQVDRYHWLP